MFDGILVKIVGVFLLDGEKLIGETKSRNSMHCLFLQKQEMKDFLEGKITHLSSINASL